jgi:hypothetical protein
MGNVLMALLPLILEAVGPAIQTIPGPMEKQYRDSIAQYRTLDKNGKPSLFGKKTLVGGDAFTLANGGGGMGQGKLQELQGQAAGQVNAQQAQQQAQLARMGAGGASGAQAAAARGAMQQGSNAMRGALSDIRAQDLSAAQERRNTLDERMKTAMGMGVRSKDIWGRMAASPQAGESVKALAGSARAEETGQMAAANGLAGGAGTPTYGGSK